MSERKRTKTQRAILHAAKGLYEKHGVGGVPFDDIAEAAGVCRTTVFNHYAAVFDKFHIAGLGFFSSFIIAFNPNLDPCCRKAQFTGFTYYIMDFLTTAEYVYNVYFMGNGS